MREVLPKKRVQSRQHLSGHHRPNQATTTNILHLKKHELRDISTGEITKKTTQKFLTGVAKHHTTANFLIVWSRLNIH